MGIMGVSMNLGASLFPPLGSYLVLEYSMDVMFYVSSFIALVSIAILMRLKETLANPQKFRPSLLKLAPHEILEPKVLPVAIVALLIYATFGVLLTISPDQADYVGLRNKGLVFTSFAVFTLISRLAAGRLSDRFGRVVVIKVSVVLMMLSLIFMGHADTVTLLMLAAGALGFSSGIASPAVFAWIIDLSPADHRGRYMATVYIALEVGIGFGAVYSAWIYDNNPACFIHVYYLTAALVLIAGVYLQVYKPERPHRR